MHEAMLIKHHFRNKFMFSFPRYAFDIVKGKGQFLIRMAANNRLPTKSTSKVHFWEGTLISFFCHQSVEKFAHPWKNHDSLCCKVNFCTCESFGKVVLPSTFDLTLVSYHGKKQGNGKAKSKPISIASEAPSSLDA